MSKDTAPANFEEAFSRVQNIVQTLEEGGTSLEDSLTLFEEGMTLIRQAQIQLQTAEDRVTTLIRENESFQEVPGIDSGSDGE